MIDLKPACTGMIDLLAGVTDEQLDGPTPCTEYTVGDLVDHVGQVCRGAAALARRDDDGVSRAGAGPVAAHLEPGWREAVSEQVRSVGEAWDDPAAWAGTGAVPGSDLSNETWGKIALTELVVHGWDLARATGQPFDLPDQTLRACLEHVAAFVPDAPVPALWGPPVAVTPDAPLVDRIVAITGRTP